MLPPPHDAPIRNLQDNYNFCNEPLLTLISQCTQLYNAYAMVFFTHDLKLNGLIQGTSLTEL